MLTKIRDGIDTMVKKIEENNRMTEVRKKIYFYLQKNYLIGENKNHLFF